jgi:hypothetical protein
MRGPIERCPLTRDSHCAALPRCGSGRRHKSRGIYPAPRCAQLPRPSRRSTARRKASKVALTLPSPSDPPPPPPWARPRPPIGASPPRTPFSSALLTQSPRRGAKAHTGRTPPSLRSLQPATASKRAFPSARTPCPPHSPSPSVKPRRLLSSHRLFHTSLPCVRGTAAAPSPSSPPPSSPPSSSARVFKSHSPPHSPRISCWLVRPPPLSPAADTGPAVCRLLPSCCLAAAGSPTSRRLEAHASLTPPRCPPPAPAPPNRRRRPPRRRHCRRHCRRHWRRFGGF